MNSCLVFSGLFHYFKLCSIVHNINENTNQIQKLSIKTALWWWTLVTFPISFYSYSPAISTCASLTHFWEENMITKTYFKSPSFICALSSYPHSVLVFGRGSWTDLMLFLPEKSRKMVTIQFPASSWNSYLF